MWVRLPPSALKQHLGSAIARLDYAGVISYRGCMDAAEFAKLGAELVEKGNELKELKETRDDLNKQIIELEKELRPLIAQHAKFVAELVGQPTVTSVPGSKPTQVPGADGQTEVSADLRKRIRQYAESRADPEDGISAAEIAEALKLDPAVVRQAMNEMARGARS